MQTFLPWADFDKSAQAFDAVSNSRRLFNQVNECAAIAKALVTGKGWVHHPATLMWKGHEAALLRYAVAVAKESADRGRPNPAIDTIVELLVSTSNYADPPWLGDSVLHDSHKSNLLRKVPDHYAPLWPHIQPNVEYAWPVLDGPNQYHLRLSKPGLRRVAEGSFINPMEVFA